MIGAISLARGDTLSPDTTAGGLNDTSTGQRTPWDLEARYAFPHQVAFAFGAANLFDV